MKALDRIPNRLDKSVSWFKQNSRWFFVLVLLMALLLGSSLIAFLEHQNTFDSSHVRITWVNKEQTSTFTNQGLSGFWMRNVESTNYYFFVESLRRIGTPEETIRDIVFSDLLANSNLVFQFPDPSPKPYWCKESGYAQTLVMWRTLEKDIYARRGLEKLGLPAPETPPRTPSELDLGFLPQRTQCQLLETYYRYELLISALMDQKTSLNRALERHAKHRQLEFERVMAMRELIPANLQQEFDIRNCNAALDLRSDCEGDFEFTEQEFRGVVQAYMQYHQAKGLFEAAWLHWRDEDLREPSDFVAEVLPADRAAEYQRTRHRTFLDLQLIATEEGTPPDSVNHFFDAFDQFDQICSPLYSRRDFSSEQFEEFKRAKSLAIDKLEAIIPGLLNRHPELWPDWLTWNDSIVQLTPEESSNK